MRTLLFLIVVIISGFTAGIIHGVINLVAVEPFLDKAINIENQNLFQSGTVENSSDFWKQFDTYRLWQKEGEVLAGGILGLAMGSLFGLVFAYARNWLPTQNNLKKSLVLCVIMWLTIFLIPFLKYPSNPPAVGDPNTIVFRQEIFVGFITISGFSALGFAILSKKLKGSRKVIGLLGYVILITFAFIIMPDNPDKILISMELVNQFRFASAITMTVFWFANAVILGLLWEKFQPHMAKIG